MTKGKALTGLVVVLSVAAAALGVGIFLKPEELASWFPPAQWLVGYRAAQGPAGRAGPRAVPVEVATAVKKETSVLIGALGTVSTIASVAIKTRLDNEIVGIHFNDGADVKKGDLLVTLDSRQLEAEIAQAQANLARDQAQLDGAERNLRRSTDLMTKGAGPQLNVENFKTQTETFRAAIQTNMAVLENLKVQLSYCTIRAPIGGRISQAAVKVGNFVRSADSAPIATINQIAPIYVTFRVPQANLPDVRAALANDEAAVEVIIPGEKRRALGRVAMIENTVDPTIGMVSARATIPNDDELLWPGTLVNVQFTVHTEDAVVVPSGAVQVSQQGPYVFVVGDSIATVKLVKVAQLLGAETVIASGVEDGDVVVTDGHLLLSNGARVAITSRR